MPDQPLDAATIMFGLTPERDRESCSTYLQILGRRDLAQTLSSRLSPEEIEQLVEVTSSLMRRHLSRQEYHLLFLGNSHRR
ncbi:MAG: hypothetical protein LJE64_12910 [Desulfofustis sp.]|jgi:hypothetical protein|nr:hypothetical protein [Desulfofustis sp.]